MDTAGVAPSMPSIFWIIYVLISKRLWSNAYLLLTLTALFWGGNAVASRLAVGEISPMMLTGLRWVFVCVLLTPFYISGLREARPTLMRRPWRMTAMAVLGFTGFNLLMYVGAHYTTAVNIGLLQGSIPAIVFLGVWLVYRIPVTLLQAAGVAVTMVGIGIVATNGSLNALMSLSLNRGDVMMFAAGAFYAAYAVMLRDRPQVPGIVFFIAMAWVACIASIPMVGIEIALGQAQWPTVKGWALLAFITVFPSLLAQIFFIRGIELIGPGRGSLFVNLVPVMAAILAVVVLREPFGWSHAVALALVLGGIALAERQRGAA